MLHSEDIGPGHGIDTGGLGSVSGLWVDDPPTSRVDRVRNGRWERRVRGMSRMPSRRTSSTGRLVSDLPSVRSAPSRSSVNSTFPDDDSVVRNIGFRIMCGSAVSTTRPISERAPQSALSSNIRCSSTARALGLKANVNDRIGTRCCVAGNQPMMIFRRL